MTRPLLVVDCQTSGVSGNMLLGALVDLGAPEEILHDLASKILKVYPHCSRLEVQVSDAVRGGFRCKYVDVEVEEEKLSLLAIQVEKNLVKVLDALKANSKVRTLAVKALQTLIDAEAKAHGVSKVKVHFHEIASADTVLDIAGVPLLLDKLGLISCEAVATPLAVGGGMVKFSHGKVSNPTPAVLEVASKKGLILHGGPVDHELTTPTGIALVASLTQRSLLFYPDIIPRQVGCGAGGKDFEGLPNIVRLVVGESPAPYLQEKIVLLETNLDDVSGEILGHTLNRLLEEGALDVNIIPYYAKKNRPAQIVRVVSPPHLQGKLVDVLIRETGSLGVRVQPLHRHVAPRSLSRIKVKIGGKSETVRFKVSRDRWGRVIRIKPEHDDLVKLSAEQGIPLREVERIIEEDGYRFLEKHRGRLSKE